MADPKDKGGGAAPGGSIPKDGGKADPPKKPGIGFSAPAPASAAGNILANAPDLKPARKAASKEKPGKKKT